jgi:hypothetical protein
MPAGHDAGPPADAPPTCSQQLGSCPATSIGIWQRLLDANDFGANARFVAMGGSAVVVARGDGRFTVVHLNQPSSSFSAAPPSKYASWDFPGGQLEPLAVTEGDWDDLSQQPEVFVLMCDQERKQCSINRGGSAGAALDSWYGTELPDGFFPRDLVFDKVSQPRMLCAYGNGLLCFQSGWQQAIPPSAELRLNDVAVGDPWSLAVGDHGRWWRRERTDSGALGVWQEQAPLRDVALTQADVFSRPVPQGAAVVTGDGRLQAALGIYRERVCSPQNGLIAFFLGSGESSYAYALTSNGDVVRQHLLTLPTMQMTGPPPEPDCIYQQLPLPSAVIKTGIAPCDDALNERALTDRVLFGTNVCLRID